jgi:hypothetical protein
MKARGSPIPRESSGGGKILIDLKNRSNPSSFIRLWRISRRIEG